MFNVRGLGRFVVAFIALNLAAITMLNAQEKFEGSREEALGVFLDNTVSKSIRLSAGSKLVFPNQQESEAIVEFASSRDADSELRELAIAVHGSRRGAVDLAIEILSDPDNGDESLKTYCIDYLNRFPLSDGNPLWPKVQTALRIVLDDEREAVRDYAYDILIARNDSQAVTKLVEGLQKEQPVLPIGRSLQLLNQSNPVQHLSAFRPFLKSKDPAVAAQAVIALSLDPRSRPEIVQMVRNDDTDRDVRIAGVESLAKADPGFPTYLMELAGSADADPEVRIEAMKGLNRKLKRSNSLPFQSRQQIQNAIESIKSQDSAPNSMKSGAEQLETIIRDKFGGLQNLDDQAARVQEVMDKSISIEKRLQSLNSLKARSSFPFNDLIGVVSDSVDSDEIRIEVTASIIRELNRGVGINVKDLNSLTERLRSIREGDSNSKLKKYADRVLPWIEERFPSQEKR